MDSTKAGASVRRRIMLLGLACVALALCAGVRLLQVDGLSVVAAVCLVLGVVAVGLALSLQRQLARSLAPLQAGVRAMQIDAFLRHRVEHACAIEVHLHAQAVADPVLAGGRRDGGQALALHAGQDLGGRRQLHDG